MTKPKPSKSVRKTVRTAPPKAFKAGPDPRRGRGPKKGAPNAGRPPDEWKAHLRTLVDRAEVLAHIEQSLKAGPADDFFEKALDYATDHGYGRATQPVEHALAVGLVQLLTASNEAE